MNKSYLFFVRRLFLSVLLSGLFIVNAQDQFLSFRDGMTASSNAITLPVRNTDNLQAQGVEISWSFSGARISDVSVDNNLYQYINIEGFTQLAQVGAPALPVHNELLAMPKGSIAKIHILESQYYEYEGFMIHPALKPALDTEGAEEPAFEIDEKLYQTNKYFPENIIDIPDIYHSRETPLVLLQIVPVQYNPVTSKIRVYTSIKLRLEFSGGEGSFDYIGSSNSLHYTNLLKRNVLNSESIPDGLPRNQNNSRTGEKEYIIITHSEYLTQANQLAEWKRQLGYSVEVVSQSSWTATQVKNEIHTRYSNWTPKPDFFVIIGDHAGSYAVPAEIHYVSGSPFSTDLYFACMDGASDWHPDMSHGRISVSNSTEAQTVVDKIINYEKLPPSPASFYNNALNCAQYQDDNNDGYADRRFCHTSENIREYLENDHGYTSNRIYYTNTSANVTTLKYNNAYYSTGALLPAELRTTSFDWSGGSTDITSAIDSGKFMVFHRDHGYSGGSGWAHPYYTTSSMNNLNNGNLLPVVFSINCHTGEFQLPNCFAEKFVRMADKGAVGVIAAAYYSYSGYNDGLAIGMIDAIWADPGLYPVFGSCGTGANYSIGPGNSIYTMGDVVNQGLYAMEQNVAWSSERQYQYELFHYFGDPAMKMWTANPNDTIITASHSSSLSSTGTLFSVTGSTPYARATLVHDNQLIGEEILDASGNGNISYSITGPGTDVILTVSKYNCKPYISMLTVTATSPTASAGGDQTLCDNEIAALSGSIGGSATSSEWASDGDGIFDDPYSLNTNYTPGTGDLTADSVLITLSTDDPDGSGPQEPAIDSLMLYFTALPAADAGDDSNICQGASITMNATATDYDSLLWISSGDGTFDNDTILLATYAPGTNDITNGMATLSLTAYALQPCSPDSSDSMMLTITQLASANAGPDDEICEDEDYLLNGSATNYSDIIWSSSGDGTFDNDTILAPTYFPGTNDILNGIVELSLTAEAISPCSSNYIDGMNLTINSYPGQPQTPGGPDTVDVIVSPSSTYTTVPGINTNTIIWIIEPDTAASLSANNSSCIVNWNAAFSGNAQLYAAGVNDCDTSWSDYKDVYVYLSTSIDEITGDLFARIIPNPSTGDFTLMLAGFTGTVNVDIIDLSGTVVQSEHLPEIKENIFSKEMNYSHLAGGVYLVKLYNKQAVVTKRLVIQ
ncbi:MAG: C25 family cysteine peptidase [Bacteroidota bacterium]